MAPALDPPDPRRSSCGPGSRAQAPPGSPSPCRWAWDGFCGGRPTRRKARRPDESAGSGKLWSAQLGPLPQDCGPPETHRLGSGCPALAVYLLMEPIREIQRENVKTRAVSLMN